MLRKDVKLDTYISNRTYQLNISLPNLFAHSAMLPPPFQETFSSMFDLIAHWVVKIFYTVLLTPLLIFFLPDPHLSLSCSLHLFNPRDLIAFWGPGCEKWPKMVDNRSCYR